MSRTRTEAPKTNTNKSGSIGRRLGEDNSGWRCPQCTFHNTEDICKMCQQPRPKFSKPLKAKPQAKPIFSENKPKKEEKKSEVYYDPTDGSFNVPIAGIKKYDHKPGKNPIPQRKVEEESKKPASNIVTLDSLKANSNIVTLDSIKAAKPEEKKINGKRDLLGLLQDAASDEPLPCMRKNQNKAKK